MIKTTNYTNSISKSFGALAGLFTIAILLLSVVFSSIIYNSYTEDKISNLPAEAHKIDYILIDSIQYIENYAKFIGQRIKEHGADDFEYIASLLGGSANSEPNPQNLFITTLFDWVTPEKEMWITSDRGVFEKPIDMSHRSYLNRTPLYPWTLQMQEPAIGIPSGQWIIPGGMGVTDNEGNHLGTITLGFAIDGIAKKVNIALGNNDTKFVLMTSDYNFVGGTLGGDRDNKYKLLVEKVKNAKNQLTEDYGTLATPIEFDGVIYTYYRKTSKYDFIVFTGYNTALPDRIYNEILLPRIMEFIVVGFVVFIVIAITNNKIIQPIIQISNTADQLSKGKLDIKIPRGGPYEIHILSKQLINLQRYIKRIQRIDKKLFKTKREAERANKAKSEFLANMSHELRTPLNAIIGYSEIIKTEMFGKIDNEKYTEYARDINDSGNYLLSLINDILDISKAEAGKFEINDQTIDITRSIHESIKLISELAAKKNIPLNIEIPNKEILMHADKLRIKQIMVNILSNAVKFSDEGQAITVKLEEQNGILISVKDNGIGIAEKDIPKILEKFGHIKNSMRRQSEGTGLGLWLTKMLVEAHDGLLEIESKIGMGTTVTIFFPDNLMIKEAA